MEMTDLQSAIERMHGGGTATLAQSVPVRETFEGKPVWEGVVHVFDLAGHPVSSPRLRLVIADRGQHQAPVLRSAAYGADQLTDRGGARGDRGGTSEPQ
jgi:hypothetical protein